MSEGAQQLEEIRNHLKEHDQRFDSFDSKLEALESRVDAKFARLDRKIGGLGVQLENVQSTVQMLAEQMSDFMRGNSDVRTRVECVEENQRMTDLRLSVLERSRSAWGEPCPNLRDGLGDWFLGGLQSVGVPIYRVARI